MKLDSKAFRRWQEQMEEIVRDIQWVVNDQAVYNSLMGVVERNREHLSSHCGDRFISFVRRCYADRIALGIRRQSRSNDKRSLAALLDQIEKCAPQLTKEFYLAQFAERSDGLSLRAWAFDCFSKDGVSIDGVAVQADRRRLDDISMGVAAYVDENVAHLDKKSSPSPTYDELEQVVDELNRLVCRYMSLVQCISCQTLEATAQDDWELVFRVPFDTCPSGDPRP